MPSTASDLERIYEQSRQEGYAAGFEKGRSRAEAEARRLAALLDGLALTLRELDQTVAEELLALALEVAKQMLGQALRLRPELVVPVVQEAIRTLPQFNQSLRVILNPQDAKLVNSHLAQHAAAAGWTVVEDSDMERGGCRVEAGGSEVDATLQSRWRRILAALGRTDEWLA